MMNGKRSETGNPKFVKDKLRKKIEHHDLSHCWRPGTPLETLTTLGVGPRSHLVFLPGSPDALPNLYTLADKLNVPVEPVGGGSNLLLTDDARHHLIVQTDNWSEKTILHRSEPFEIRVEAGHSLPALVRFLDDLGWRSFGRLAGIPGSVGGAVVGNSGTRQGEISSFVERVRVYDPETSAFRWITDPGFSYRDSTLREVFVVEVQLKGTNRNEDLEDPPASRIHNHRLESQPVSERTSGCVFENPNQTSAGALIEDANLKGTSRGGAVVSEEHANFIVNKEDADPEDVLELIRIMRGEVKKQHGIQLETEIQIV